MGLLDRFKSKKSVPNPAYKWFEIPLEFTDDEVEAINEYLATVNSVAQSQHGVGDDEVYVAERVENGFRMQALSDYCEELLTTAKYGKTTEDQGADLIQRAVSAKIKSFKVFPVPIILFQIGIIFELIGNKEEAKAMFHSFLDGQSKFVPDKIDAMFLDQMISTDEAILMARQKLGLK